METMYLRYFTQNTDFPFFIQYGQHDSDLFMHTHADFNELAIVLSGTAVHIVDNEKFLIKKGDVFIISDDIVHGYENPHDFKICNIMYRSNNLLWSDTDIRKSAGFHALFMIEPYLNKNHKFQSRLHLSLAEFENVSAMTADMIHEYHKQSEGWKTILTADFMRLTVLLSRFYCISLDCNENFLNLAIPIAYIENHYTETITTKELARQAKFSVRHFSRLFHNAYNTTPGDYIIQLRIQYSCMLLKNKNLAITEIASKCGFNDSNYFTRQFKKVMRITPSQYRKFIL